jgi:decaprenylphospho-beta-D-ribofuranose 2-oxidase
VVLERLSARDLTSTYSVAWIDPLARGGHLGRSVLTVGEHALSAELTDRRAERARPTPGTPRAVAPPLPNLINRASTRAFNEFWFRKAPSSREGQLQTIASFFHPLDGVGNWNRVYGRRGLVQYQFVLPDSEVSRLRRILERISASREASFLTVLKRFGPANAGHLSFPTSGWTLAVDLPAHPHLHPLLTQLDREVVSAGGRIYLAKDGRLDPGRLAEMYPRLGEFREVRARVDPHRVFQSDLSRRLDL